MTRSHAARIAGVLHAVFANPRLRRMELAFAGFNAAEWGVWIAMLVYAYDQGGATAAGLVALVQLVPSGLYAPFAATLADRHDPGRVLALGYVAQAAAMAATAVALFASGPPALAYALAAVAASATTITRPAQAVLVPALVRSADELTATNVVSGWTEAVSLLIAPAAAGAMLALGGPELVFAVLAAVALGSAALSAPLHGAPGGAEGTDDEGGSLAQAAAGFRSVARDPASRVLVGVLGGQFLVIGALDVLFVVLAAEVLDLGGSGAGYLNAAFGAGGVLGIAATVSLVGRARLAPPLTAALFLWSLALLGLGLWSSVPAAFVLFAVGGGARAVLDVTARTLLQRTAPSDVLARVFGLLETLDSIGLALGALLAPALVALLGPHAAMAGLAVVLPVLLLLAGRSLATVDESADVPVVEVALLRALPLFEPLGAPELEGLARQLRPVELEPGQSVLEEGQPGERYYVVADGTLEVSRSSVAVATVGRGDGVGEVSLLLGIPCTATVTATRTALLYALEAEPFIEVVTGHPASARAADRLVSERAPQPALG
jgi:MFS family permease